MPSRPAVSLDDSEASSSTSHVFDGRLQFLRSLRVGDGSGATPLRNRFEHRANGAEGDVEVVYYPRRDGSQEAPDQLSLFILGPSTPLYI